MQDIWKCSATEIAKRVNERQITAVQVVKNGLQRLDEANPALNAVVEYDKSWSLAQAKVLDDRIASGEQLPLAGVPITVKDNIWVAGRRITQGSLTLKDFIAPQHAWAVQRLIDAGAVVIGITNCSEFACKGVSNNLVYGSTRSPWDVNLTPGGSSGGAASATAAGIGALALGTDAGGSTRRPAAHTGLVGMKPTFGLIPVGPGFDEPNFGLSVMGQLGRDVADVALMFQTLVSYSHLDWGSQQFGAISFTLDRPPPKSLKIAWSPDLGCGFAVDADVLCFLESVVNKLSGQGYQIEIAAPLWPEGVREYPLLKLQQAGLAALHGAELDANPDWIDPDIADQIRLGRQHSAEEIARVLVLREHIYAAYAAFFQDFDLLLCPTTPTVSWPIDQLGPSEIGGQPAGPRGHAAFTPLFNYAQAPACSVPAGLVRGLPIGLQIVAARYRDSLVLEMAAEVERLVSPLPHPPIWDHCAG